MNDMNDKWINDIRSRIDDYSEPLPAGLWEKIDAEISTPAHKVIPMWRKWTYVAAAAVVLLAVSTVSVWLWNSDAGLNEANNVLSENNEMMLPEDNNMIMSDVKAVEVIDEDGKRLVSENANKADVQTENKRQTVGVSNIPAQAMAVMMEDVSSDNERTKPDTESVTDIGQENDGNEGSVSLKEERIKRMMEDRETARRNASFLAMTDKKSGKRSGLQLGVMTGNIPYSSSNSFSGMSRLAVPLKSTAQVNDVVVGEISDVTASYSQMLFNNMGRQTYTDIKHHVPVTVGASVKWSLNEDWALESGLNYTYLYSELRSGAKSYIEDKQKLHYVGIPLKVQRSVWSSRIFSFYASAGGMMEKCVSGSVETVCVDDNDRKTFAHEKLEVKPLQFSVLASLGVQANFSKLLSLYLEPGMIYYFDDNTEILTIRKDKPFNFNLQLGLRFNLSK